MESNYLLKEEGFLGGCTSSCYSSFLAKAITISVKGVDLKTGLALLESLSKVFNVKSILIKSVRRKWLPEGNANNSYTPEWRGSRVQEVQVFLNLFEPEISPLQDTEGLYA